MTCYHCGHAPGLSASPRGPSIALSTWRENPFRHLGRRRPRPSPGSGLVQKFAFGGLVQLLLTSPSYILPSAVQARGDWRKSLNWRTLGEFHPTVTTALSVPCRQPLGACIRRQAHARGELADGRRNPRDWAHRRNSGSSSRQAPPFAGAPASAVVVLCKAQNAGGVLPSDM